MSAWCRALQDSHAAWRALLLFTMSRTLRDSRIFGGTHDTRSAALGWMYDSRGTRVVEQATTRRQRGSKQITDFFMVPLQRSHPFADFRPPLVDIVQCPTQSTQHLVGSINSRPHCVQRVLRDTEVTFERRYLRVLLFRFRVVGDR